MTTTTDALLTLTGIRKHYGGVYALQGVDFEVRPGEVHGLVGANGAGKSTLIKIVSGAEKADEGTASLNGEALGDTVKALRAGIATVYQDPQLFGELTVAENVFVGRELRRNYLVDWREQQRRATELLTSLGLSEKLAGQRVADLSVAEQQLVSVAKALAHEARILILDEPSAILTDREIETLFTAIRTLKDRGVGIIYVSHRLDELAQITDRVTVLRDGKVVASEPTKDLTVRQIAELMVGHAINGTTAEAGAPQGEPVLRVEDLNRRNRFTNVSLEVRPGEIVSLFGLVGSGTGSIARAIYGVEPADSGTVRTGQTAMLPGDRSRQGVFATKTVGFNISIASLKGLWLKRKQERRTAIEFIERMQIKTPGPNALIATLSGGNQQKVVLARQLVERPEVLVLEEPTQGVDVGAKEEIHGLVRDIVGQGTAVLLVSSDLPEVMSLAEKILVVRGGRITARFDRGAAQADVLAAAAGDE
ncbi:sugar ABC transporter ATP-binding protein [Kibdelosporangium philippinense]|uniref:Sugar ABC transporter ATP-binding protein n=1 Tax=Kibdelosporangium philippinense TaxID=211113 RepID=A0ABS8ZIF4_9PSEU|nr:sugar ABC transporter ATP-binding protein [Kibdelosporangium philippinense]MCE7007581.1 sugar ABC transporter ATP-binding protein [Kibdelosporangium philippinense]